MSEYQLRTADNLAVRVDAADEHEALVAVAHELPDGAEGSIERADLPVGWDGDDPEAESPLETGDHV